MGSNLSGNDMTAKALGRGAESAMLRQAQRIADLEAALQSIVNQVTIADDPKHMTLSLVGKIAAHALQAK